MWARERQRYTEGGTASCRGREPESSRRLTLTRYAIDLLVWVHSKSLTLELNSWRLHLEKQMWIWSTPITSFSLSSPPSPPPQPKIHKVSLQTSMREWKVYVVEKQNISLLLRSECLHANVCCCLLILYIIYVCCVVVPSLDEDACRASEREVLYLCLFKNHLPRRKNPLHLADILYETTGHTVLRTFSFSASLLFFSFSSIARLFVLSFLVCKTGYSTFMVYGSRHV